MLAIDRVIHWLILDFSQVYLLELAILRYQFFQPGVTFGQDLKVEFHWSRFISLDLKGIHRVSALI